MKKTLTEAVQEALKQLYIFRNQVAEGSFDQEDYDGHGIGLVVQDLEDALGIERTAPDQTATCDWDKDEDEQ